MNQDHKHRWTITGKDSSREQSYYMMRDGYPPGWFPESWAKKKAANFGEWEQRADQPPPRAA